MVTFAIAAFHKERSLEPRFEPVRSEDDYDVLANGVGRIMKAHAAPVGSFCREEAAATFKKAGSGNE